MCKGMIGAGSLTKRIIGKKGDKPAAAAAPTPDASAMEPSGNEPMGLLKRRSQSPRASLFAPRQ